jgi:hypothetical protein
MDCVAKRLACRKAAAYYGRAIRAHDDTVKRPAGRRKLKGRGTDLCFELSRTALMGEAEGLGVHGTAPDKNSQATACPAVLVECGIDIDDEALSQARYPPGYGDFSGV